MKTELSIFAGTNIVIIVSEDSKAVTFCFDTETVSMGDILLQEVRLKKVLRGKLKESVPEVER